jgi:MFS family permease
VTLTLTVAWLFFAADHPHHHRRVNAAEIGLIEAGRVQSSTNAKSARELEIEEDLEELEHEMVEASLPYDHDPAQHEPLWRDRNLLVLTLSYSLNGYFQYLFFYWLHYYFYDQMKLDAGKAGFYSAIPLLTMAAGMPLGGLISDWIQPRVGRLRSRAVVAITGMSAASVFLFIALTAAEPAWIAFWLALSMGSLGTSESAFWATVIDSAGKRSGAASAFVNAGNNGFGLLAPVVTPLVSSLAGWTFAISLAGVASFASAMCWFWIKPTAVDMPTAEANSLATS